MAVRIHSMSTTVTVDGDGALSEGILKRLVDKILEAIEEEQQEQRRGGRTSSGGQAARRDQGSTISVSVTVDTARDPG
jgi:hypothetical protein